MNRLQPVEEILMSWRRCINSGLINSAAAVSTYISEDALQTALNASKPIISLFDEIWRELERLTANKSLVFLLTSPEGVLLKKSVAEN
ncbi:hypothetical protein [Ruminiclostridium cellulolyticum]|uniref:Regulatory protein, LuxR n=1 Tax=Ruminiclostridium cellulolyticum (strain ATCC 35319 / DSM 5812 / JCM 6584 / H10) TaxID=394503 RepID=B8I687_RUMCH|nr:hypothetical protein [Ruminiclostridium cellulolyticum]ACL76852.1 regulatory protein, LuxR [Ruminiclostridium cellulolyticum H10]